ncbi:MAG: DUF1273 family protein [Clostridiales bacterium]|nr:DUF1273 family protein [Clostridiales bacterium]
MKTEKRTLEDIKILLGDCVKELNSKTACFTGHRSQKLPWKFNEEDDRYLAIKKTLRKEIEKAIQGGYTTFLCGMALGFDMLCAETVLNLKKQYNHIKIIGALPCKNQDELWSPNEKNRYRQLLGKLDGIRCIYDKYIGNECMIERNKYMVNNSSLMIALYNGCSGGTKATIEYAKKQKLQIVTIKP